MLLKFVEKQCADSKGQYIRYDVINIDNKFRIGYFVRGFVFENDKYHCYQPEELIEIVDFIKAKMEEQNENN
jgi:uncharacterized protein YfkK (UPF0435 family)